MELTKRYNASEFIIRSTILQYSVYYTNKIFNIHGHIASGYDPCVISDIKYTDEFNNWMNKNKIICHLSYQYRTTYIEENNIHLDFIPEIILTFNRQEDKLLFELTWAGNEY